jgi:hypothetical protein
MGQNCQKRKDGYNPNIRGGLWCKERCEIPNQASTNQRFITDLQKLTIKELTEKWYEGAMSWTNVFGGVGFPYRHMGPSYAIYKNIDADKTYVKCSEVKDSIIKKIKDVKKVLDDPDRVLLPKYIGIFARMTDPDDRQCINEVYKAFQTKRPVQHYVAVHVLSAFDHNGSIHFTRTQYASISPLRVHKSEHGVEQGVVPLVIKVQNMEQIIDTLKELNLLENENKKIVQLAISGHGDREYLVLNDPAGGGKQCMIAKHTENKCQTCGIEHATQFDVLRKGLHPGARIYLASCSNGADGDEKIANNLHYVAETYFPGHIVLGYSTHGNLGDVKFYPENESEFKCWEESEEDQDKARQCYHFLAGQYIYYLGLYKSDHSGVMRPVFYTADNKHNIGIPDVQLNYQQQFEQQKNLHKLLTRGAPSDNKI